jgi:hypothetical protein
VIPYGFTRLRCLSGGGVYPLCFLRTNPLARVHHDLLFAQPQFLPYPLGLSCILVGFSVLSRNLGTLPLGRCISTLDCFCSFSRCLRHLTAGKDVKLVASWLRQHVFLLPRLFLRGKIFPLNSSLFTAPPKFKTCRADSLR